MLAFISWHFPAPHVERAKYEHALERFHRSLAHVRPSGFHSSAAAWIPRLPWVQPDDPRAHEAYEDWYLLEGWSALGVLEEAAVSRQHLAAHEAVAALADFTTSGLYRLIEGEAQLAGETCIWVSRPTSWKGHGAEAPLALAGLLGDGMEPAEGWPVASLSRARTGAGVLPAARHSRHAPGWRGARTATG